MNQLTLGFLAIESIIEGAGLALSTPTVYFLVLGILGGIFVGMIPGVGPAVGMVILIPISAVLDPLDAIILLVGIYSGAKYGGSISAIMINAPGTAGAAATTIDGYALTKKGKAQQALLASVVSSAVGGSLSMVIFLLIVPVMTIIVLALGSPEYFLIVLVGIATITFVEGSLVKGFTAGAFGLMLTTIGFAPMAAEARYTFGLVPLYGGFSFVAGLIGLFAIAEMIKLSSKTGGVAAGRYEAEKWRLRDVAGLMKNWMVMLKSGIIGLLVGTIPGAGSSVSNFVAYTEEIRSGKAGPVPYGEGNIRGVIAPESANNATVAGALIPTLAFGIPGSGAMAVLLGGLLIHGIRPGPQLFSDELSLTYGLLMALLIGNLVILIVGMALVARLGFFSHIETDIYIPIVIVISTVGVYSLRMNWFDVTVLLIFAILGYYLVNTQFSPLALVLGIVLGELAEINLFRSLLIGGDSWLIFVDSNVSKLLVAIFIFIILAQPISNILDRYRDTA